LETDLPVRVRNLSKTFPDPVRGDVHAVRDVSFEVRPGEIYGLLGPNGAGKTTTLRCMVGLLAPTEGVVALAGNDVARSPREARRSVGFLAAGAGLPERLTVRETVRFFGELYDLRTEQLEERVREALEEFGLGDRADEPASRLSTGYKQRLSLARATIHNPPVLLLDEATSGLDPLVARTVRASIRRSCEQGRAVVFSSHIMSEVAALCDRVGVLHRGRLMAEGSPAELCERTGTTDLESAFVALAGGDVDA